MSLSNSKMNVILQISSRVFGRRMEIAYKESHAANCMPDLNTTLGPITGIVTELRGERFIKDDSNRSYLVLELGVRFSLNGIPNNMRGEIQIAVEAESAGGSLIFDISLQYEEFVIFSPLPIPPDVQTQLDNEIRSRIEPILANNRIPMDLRSVFANVSSIFGNPEITIVGGTNDSAPILAIGLEIFNQSEGRDSSIDRTHFTNNYAENLIPPGSGSDWAIQIESRLMETKMQEEFDRFDLGEIIPRWTRTDLRAAYWSGNGLHWDYKGWKDYINSHYTEHHVWLACKGLVTQTITYYVVGWENWHPTVETRKYDIDVGIYWFAYADLRIENDTIILDPYIFEAGIRNNIAGAVLPEFSFDIEQRGIGSARFGDDLFISSLDTFTTEHLIGYGRDLNEGLSGSPRIEDVPTEVGVNYVLVPESIVDGSLHCTTFSMRGELEGDSVISHFEVSNRGNAPLWICSFTVENDADGVFTLRLPRTPPFRLGADESVIVDILLTVPDDDHQSHQCTARIRCNDFNQPEISIPVHGIKEAEATGVGSCFSIPGQEIPGESLGKIIDVIYGDIMERFPEAEDLFPPAPEPDPAPCRVCGYYMDIAVSGLPVDVYIDVLGSSNRSIERSKVFGVTHYFSVPLHLTRKSHYKISIASIEQGIVIKPAISRIARAGQYISNERVSQIDADREFVFVLHQKGIDVVNISIPKKPGIVNKIEIEKCIDIGTSNGYLYAQTMESIEIIDINDPYAPNPHRRRITTEPHTALLIGQNSFILIDRKKVRTYEVLDGARQRLISESRIQDTIKKHPRFQNTEYLLARKGTLLLTGRPKQKEDFILQDDYLLRIFDDRGGFDILQKDTLPFIFKKTEIDKLTTIIRGAEKSGKTKRTRKKT